MSGYVRAYEGSEPYIFVSYAHKDSEAVLPVIQALYGKKYRIWYDEGIAPGSEWPENIALHLKKASAVMVFVSDHYLASPNCKNELRVADEQKKKTIQIALDNAGKQPLFADATMLDFDENTLENLKSVIGHEFIGDGVTGYQYSIDKKRSFNKWNIMLGLAAALAVVFTVALYGLYSGWFDDFLPGKQETVIAAATPAPSREAISISGNIVGSVLPVEFPSDEEKNAVYEKLGWNGPSQMTYKDLLGMKGLTQLEIGSEPITDIAFAAFLPDLKMIALNGSKITDLTPLAECPKLKTVRVSAGMLPLKIPDERNFELEIN
jgi:Leucine-rich repeat (LRR) protein